MGFKYLKSHINVEQDRLRERILMNDDHKNLREDFRLESSCSSQGHRLLLMMMFKTELANKT